MSIHTEFSSLGMSNFLQNIQMLTVVKMVLVTSKKSELLSQVLESSSRGSLFSLLVSVSGTGDTGGDQMGERIRGSPGVLLLELDQEGDGVRFGEREVRQFCTNSPKLI